MRSIAFIISLSCLAFSCSGQSNSGVHEFPVQKSPEEWKEVLSEEEYEILREKGTEPSYSGDLLTEKRTGIYTCAGCNQELFKSNTKFESGTGWPSFYDAVNGKVVLQTDSSFFLLRQEILCSNCGGHLGHVFDDGPKPTGLRYCVNSLSLDFIPKEKP